MDGEFTDAWCYEIFRRVRWPGGIACPFCGGRRLTTHAKSRTTPRLRYLCLTCRRTFTDLTGTPLARTNLPLATWFACLLRLGDRRTVAELARELGVKWDTAAHLLHRLARARGEPGLIGELLSTLSGHETSRRDAGEVRRSPQ